MKKTMLMVLAIFSTNNAFANGTITVIEGIVRDSSLTVEATTEGFRITGTPQSDLVEIFEDYGVHIVRDLGSDVAWELVGDGPIVVDLGRGKDWLSARNVAAPLHLTQDASDKIMLPPDIQGASVCDAIIDSP